jgi:outer membrane protein assembly factor BamB
MEKALRYWWTKLWLWQMAPRPPLPQGYLWQQRDVGNVSAHPLAFDDDRIYLGAVDDATRGRITALDKETGEALWEFQSGSAIADKAALSGDILVAGNKGGTLFALDSSSGDTVWQIDVGSPIATAPAISGTRILIPTLDGLLIAYQ